MMQWMGIFTVTFGLTIVLIGSEHEGTKVTYGIVLILLGALLHSLSYVISEYLLIVSDDPIAPEYLCTLLGLLSGSINIFWQIIYTIPRFDVLVTDKILQHHGNAQVVSVVYLLLIWIAFTNSASFYTIIGRFGRY
jgi:drug/metabolite transporter (DMT)-like permease